VEVEVEGKEATRMEGRGLQKRGRWRRSDEVMGERVGERV